ncbi:MAG: FAD-dependent oxidoreductase [Gemmatimonadota bacterium]|jgi:predicted NAD/FAD-binding protein
MRIAIVGSGVSGLTAAHLLHRLHEVTVFEARHQVGGHVNTVEIEGPDGRSQAVDTGFIVYNESNYPLFTKLLQRLNVATQPSNMSFGVRCDETGLEYSSATPRTLFAQRRNLFDPGFHRMLRDILRFNREALPAIQNAASTLSLGEYLDSTEFSPRFAKHYLLPMGSALWSIPQGQVLEMPAEFFVRFFENHGMLTVNDQPEWRVIRGGSARYVEALVAPFHGSIRTSTPVKRVQRHPAHVTVDGERFDHVIFACHSDQALAALVDSTGLEREILDALPFQKNEVVLHTDTSVLPRARKAWASWNYHVRQEEGVPATVTYNMNRLQTLDATQTYCVTLNDTESVDPEAILYRAQFSHPTYTVAGMQAQQRRCEISGVGRTHYCGAYWGFGFHEDGVRSAVDVTERFGGEL